MCLGCAYTDVNTRTVNRAIACPDLAFNHGHATRAYACHCRLRGWAQLGVQRVTPLPLLEQTCSESCVRNKQPTELTLTLQVEDMSARGVGAVLVCANSAEYPPS
jgi:hypothetical protein